MDKRYSRETRYGGLAVPSLFQYYQVCHLSHLMCIFYQDNKPAWVQLYEEDIASFTLETILCQKTSQRTCKVVSNTYLTSALCQWDAIKTKFSPHISRFSSFLQQDWFWPGFYNSWFHIWEKSKMTMLIDLTQNGKILDKAGLEKKLESQISWYAYLQL